MKKTPSLPPKRNIQDIEADIEKLTILMETLTQVAGVNGYTIRQRIEHHEKMATFLKEKLSALGGTPNR